MVSCAGARTVHVSKRRLRGATLPVAVPFSVMQESRWVVRARTLAHICSAAQSVDDAALAAVGFKRVPSAGLPVTATTLPVSLFVPLFFPIEQTRGSASPEHFSWSRAPREITVVATVTSQDRYRDQAALWRDVDAFRDSCLDERKQLALVRDTAAYIRASVNVLREAFDLGARRRDVRLDVTGYCQGGAIAAAATLALLPWGRDAEIDVYCTTFDAPGVHPRHFRQAPPDKHVWEDRVTNFVCDPNQINMINQHVGRIIHLRNDVGRGGWTWTARCLAADGLRFAALSLLRQSSVRTCIAKWMTSLLRGVRRRTAVAALLLLFSGMLSRFWPSQKQKPDWLLRLALRTTPEENAHSHSLKRLIQRLESNPQGITEMQSWPRYDALGASLPEILLLALHMHLPLSSTSMGVRFILEKQRLLSNRLRALKGYKPMV